MSTDKPNLHLQSALVKLRARPVGQNNVNLWAHEADALFKEFCRLANFATLLGEPSPAEMAGLAGDRTAAA